MWTTWKDWSNCSEICGNNGTKIRSRDIQQNATNGGTPCDEKDNQETEPCNTDPCPGKSTHFDK